MPTLETRLDTFIANPPVPGDARVQVESIQEGDTHRYLVLLPDVCLLEKSLHAFLGTLNPSDFSQSIYGILSDWDVSDRARDSKDAENLVRLHAALEPHWSEYERWHRLPLQRALDQSPLNTNALLHALQRRLDETYKVREEMDLHLQKDPNARSYFNERPLLHAFLSQGTAPADNPFAPLNAFFAFTCGLHIATQDLRILDAMSYALRRTHLKRRTLRKHKEAARSLAIRGCMTGQFDDRLRASIKFPYNLQIDAQGDIRLEGTKETVIIQTDGTTLTHRNWRPKVYVRPALAWTERCGQRTYDFGPREDNYDSLIGMMLAANAFSDPKSIFPKEAACLEANGSRGWQRPRSLSSA